MDQLATVQAVVIGNVKFSLSALSLTVCNGNINDDIIKSKN